LPKTIPDALQIEVERVIEYLRNLNQQRLAVVQQLEQDLQKADLGIQQMIENTRSQIQRSLAMVQQLKDDLQGDDATFHYLSDVTKQMRDLLAIKVERDEIMTHTPVRLPMFPETQSSRNNSDISLLEAGI
jgi:hypothetical protein